jgi:hypothetical protein
MMKKLLLTLVLVLVAVSPALAFDLGSYVGPVVFDFQNYDVGTIWPSGFANSADGKTDSFAVLTVAAITKPDSTVLWSQTPGEAIEGMVYGLDDDDVAIGIVGPLTFFAINSIGGKVDLYLGSQDLNQSAEPKPTMPFAGLGAPTDLWNATNGASFLSLEFVPGIDIDNTTYQSSFSINSSGTISGIGNGYMKVVGGAYASMFDSNVYDSISPSADFYFTNGFNNIQSTFGWLVRSDGTANGTVIPEPASMILMGIGLAGAARLRRRTA